MKEKIDILLTTYRTDRGYLKEQMDSILNQTYSNFNLLVSDDHSQDPELVRILQEYEKNDKRVKLYLQKENLGYNQNFEFLLKQSTADYICFSDHDDVWYPQKIEKTLAILKEKQVDMVYGNCHQINEAGEIIQEDYFQYKNVPLIQGKSHLAISRCIGIGCSQMITKKVKEKMIPFTKSVIAHDWLAAFIANENNGMTYLKESLFAYRLHTNNVFGGRSLSQNLGKWKQEHGKTYSSYLKYRKEKVIDQAYLDGIKMCLDYCQIEKNRHFMEKAITYYEKLERTKYFNVHMLSYFQLLAGRNLGKKMLKELILFHVPILGYLIFSLG